MIRFGMFMWRYLRSRPPAGSGDQERLFVLSGDDGEFLIGDDGQPMEVEDA